MCRLPLDLMTRIIELVRVPTPFSGFHTITWADLRQADLVSLMRASRLTYFIAAPLLYKEVVVNNLASFFLGFDDDKQPHHEECSQLQSQQTRICQLVVRKDGSNYKCCRHQGSPLNDHPSFDQSPIKAGIFHKQQLLQMVEAVHFVYSSADRHMYGSVQIEDFIDEDGKLDEEILQFLDVERYLNVPDFIKADRSWRPLPNLKRLVVGGWLGETANVNAIVKTKCSSWFGLRDAETYRTFERYLAGAIFQLAAPFVCQYPCNGFLAHYPAPLTPLRTCVNTIHEADLTSYGPRLVLGADNIVRVDDLYVYMKPIARFDHDMSLAASQLVDAVNRWHESSTGPIEDDLTFTTVTFVIGRPREQHYDDMTDDEIDRADDALEGLQEVFSELLAGSESLPGDWNDDIWSIVWEEGVPNCPACEWKWTDHDLYEPFITTPSPASTPSP